MTDTIGFIHPLDSGFQTGDIVVDLTAEVNDWPDLIGTVIRVDGSNVLVKYKKSQNERWKVHFNLVPKFNVGDRVINIGIANVPLRAHGTVVNSSDNSSQVEVKFENDLVLPLFHYMLRPARPLQLEE